jgi:hypothetical protein
MAAAVAVSERAAPLAIAAGGRIVPDWERNLVGELLREFAQLYSWRNTFASQWEEVASLIDVASRNTFFYQNFYWQGQKKTQQQIDATGMLALHRFAAICDSLLTPANSQWHSLEASDDYVMKDRATRMWFDLVTKLLFKHRRAPTANFRGENYKSWRSLGCYGNSTLFIDAFDGRTHHGLRGLRYRACPLGETFYGENHQGQVDRITRWFRMTAAQAAQRWGMERLPANLHAPLIQSSQWPYNFLHVVKPRDNYDPQRLDVRSMPFSSFYVAIEGQCLMQEEGGFNVFPYAVSRYDQAPLEVYGRGPAQQVLPALKTLNAQKATFLKQGHKASDPVLITADDGLTDFKNRPGAVNKGGVNPDGRPLVHVLPTGKIEISKEMMAEERAIIDDMFLVSLFKVLSEHPNMTATQVIELVNEKGILVAPTLGRQETEKLGPMIDRELDVLMRLGLLPPMPPRLREARGEYQVIYTSPLALSQRAGMAAGFVRTVETAKEIVNITQDPSYLDPFDFDTAIPEIAQIQAVPERWMADPEAIARKRQARAQSQQQQAQIQAMPAQAAMLKAQAAVAKNQPGLGTAGLGGPQPAFPQG